MGNYPIISGYRSVKKVEINLETSVDRMASACLIAAVPPGTLRPVVI
jgi:hypothetical protein